MQSPLEVLDDLSRRHPARVPPNYRSLLLRCADEGAAQVGELALLLPPRPLPAVFDNLHHEAKTDWLAVAAVDDDTVVAYHTGSDPWVLAIFRRGHPTAFAAGRWSDLGSCAAALAASDEDPPADETTSGLVFRWWVLVAGVIAVPLLFWLAWAIERRS